MIRPLEPNEPVAVTLTAQQWQNVVLLLGEAPYKLVAEIIPEIRAACQLAGVVHEPEPKEENGAVSELDRAA